MQLRTFRLAPLVVALAATALPLSGASGVSKCPLIVDQQGDANAPPAVSSGANLLFSSQPAYDILSADIASDRRTMNIVIRVVKLATSASMSPLGIEWRFDFTAGQNLLFAEVVSDTNGWGQKPGVSAYIGYVDGTAHLIKTEKAVLDFKHNEVRMRIPISDFADHAPAVGTKLTDLMASGGRWYDVPGYTYSETDDRATTDNSYILGHTTCIPA